jgi:hypothetical protein
MASIKQAYYRGFQAVFGVHRIDGADPQGIEYSDNSRDEKAG